MPFPTGARPSPRHKLASAIPHIARPGIPDSFLVLPKQLSVWGNDRFGDCVTAEEAFAKAAYGTMGGSEVFVDQQTVIDWASSHGYLNGADLTSVMDSVIQDGITASDDKLYHDGHYNSVDWTNDATLRSAIFTGPVKLGMAAGQLQGVPGVGQQNGWFATGFGRDGNIDHCTALCGYGTAAQLVALFAAAGVQVAIPGGVDPSTPCYGYFTWGTVGIMDRSSMINTTDEAWVRTPTTPESPQPQPTPDPTPTPTPGPTPTPVPPAPTPTPTPIPDTQGWWYATTKTVRLPAGWRPRRAFGAMVVIHPQIHAVDVPMGWTIQS